MKIKQFRESNQPYHLPENMDLLSWSLPFIASKVVQMLYYIISQNSDYTPSILDLEDIDFSKL